MGMVARNRDMVRLANSNAHAHIPGAAVTWLPRLSLMARKIKLLQSRDNYGPTAECF